MFHRKSMQAIAFSLAALPGFAAAGNPPGVVLYTPGDMKWHEWGISAQRAILAGDPNHHGCAYTDRVRFMANTTVAAHSLPEDKIYTVISGTLYVGIGGQRDESRLRKMPPGSFWTIPAKEEVVFQSTAMANPNAKDCVDAAGSRGNK